MRKKQKEKGDHSVRVSLVGSYSWPHHTRERKRGGEHFGSPFFLLQLPLVRCSFFLMLFQVLQLQKKSIEFKTWKTYLGRVGEEPEGPSLATIFFLSLATTSSVAMLLLVSSRSFSSKWAEYLQRESNFLRQFPSVLPAKLCPSLSAKVCNGNVLINTFWYQS